MKSVRLEGGTLIIKSEKDFKKVSAKSGLASSKLGEFI
jgi:hypothetical protein